MEMQNLSSDESAIVRQTLRRIAEENLTTEEAALEMLRKIQRRTVLHSFKREWAVLLWESQFMTHIGPYERIRCGSERRFTSLYDPEGRDMEVCDSCFCEVGEYHKFGCDSEQCSHCHEQAYFCDCPD